MITLNRLLPAILFAAAVPAWAQTSTGDILGTISDASGAAVGDARVSIKNLETNATRQSVSGANGSFRAALLPAGSYEVSIEKAGFSKYLQGPIELRLNQAAELKVTLNIASLNEVVTVSGEAPLINTTNAEISTHFDSRRIADLPLSTNRNVLNLAASVPGVAQISAGNSNFGSNGNQGTESSGLSYSANGMRQRSNAFIIDGQDSYYVSTGGLLQPMNNPDIIAEVRIVTNQFLPEYGRAGGSVMNIITKSGTNQYHGSLFWFHNSNKLNAMSNADHRSTRLKAAPFRVENQFGGTVGGRIIRDKTFGFGSVQRWTDRRLGSGTSILGAPSEEGRRILQNAAGTRPTVRALLENLPAGQPNGQVSQINVGGQALTIPLSTLTGAGGQTFNNWQYSYRLDHRFNDKHSLMARYLDDNTASLGTGQLTPAGLSEVRPNKTKSAGITFASTLSPQTLNELRIGYSRQETATNATDPAVAERIPSIEIPELGLRGFNSATSRTGIGLAANLPQRGTFNNYQVQDSVTLLRGLHSVKAGFDFRRQEQFSLFLPQLRGRIEYATLQRLIDDEATVAQINSPLRGGEFLTYMRYYDYFFFVQDEFRVKPNFTFSYGIRYETPGNPIQNLADLNQRIVAANGSDERYRLYHVPKRDKNNWAPRLGFNYRFGKGPGMMSWLTGNGKLVLRGGYSRTYEVAFNNIALNIASSFPLVAAFNVPTVGAVTPNAFAQVEAIRGGAVPAIANPNILVRTIVSKDFRSPYAEQISFQFQRELTGGWALSSGYVGTKGTALFQSIDGNPTLPTANGTARSVRVDSGRGVIRERCNCTASTYHSWQTSLEKRLSRNFLMAAHYTWSSFIDGASEIFNPSVSGEIAFPQNPYDRHSERSRSTYDRPHRFTINGVWELPAFRGRKDAVGRILGGWQVNGFLTLQSGAPFGVLNGVDPGNVVLGNIVGTSIRPFLNTSLDLSSLGVREIQAAGGRSLFTAVTAANPVGNAGRNILRADGINRLDFGLVKNIRVREGHKVQIQANFYNATNTRDWGIPDGVFTSAAFLNEGVSEVPARKIQMGLRYQF